jgi:hypothetical protein
VLKLCIEEIPVRCAKSVETSHSECLELIAQAVGYSGRGLVAVETPMTKDHLPQKHPSRPVHMFCCPALATKRC